MPLAPGTRLGSYEVIGPLGAGGMGEVYRARDPRLGRDVAIKALPDGFARDPERLARFEREARLLASLTHAHIAGIHGLEEHDGQRYLILEFVDGETLADRLRRGALPLDEAIETARDIAQALEAAHESGIVHRDLKPGNIMLTPAGAVKVLDFGLAKAGAAGSSSSDLSASPTMTHAATGAGVILGTAAYMSPEQARGKPVDRRTDIWSFGCVLYECLTGRPTFEGETVSDLVAKILQGDADWNALPPRTPAVVRRLLERCLRKDARERLRDIGDARIELEELLARGLSGSDVVGTTDGTVASAQRALRSQTLAWSVAGIASAIGLALAAVLLFFPDRAPRSVAPFPIRTTLTSPPGTEMSTTAAEMEISPDGTMIVFTASDSAGTRHLWLRPLDSLDSRLVEGVRFEGDETAGLPFWSPDSRAIGFFMNGKLRTVPVAGGPPQVVTSVTNARGGTWNREGVILFAPSSQGPLFRVSQAGGEPVQVTTLDSTETAHRFPRFLPDGRHYEFVALPGADGKLDTWIGELGSTRRTPVASASSGALFVAPGHVVFLREQSLVAQPFDLRHRRLTGEAIRIGEAPTDLRLLGAYLASASANGILIYPTSTPSPTRLTWFGRDGKPQGDLAVPEGEYVEIAFSPDNRHIALLRRNSPASEDVWIVNATRGTTSRLTTDGVHKFTVLWSGDGQRVAYATLRGSQYDYYQRAASGAGDEEVIPVSSSPFKNVSQFTRDGAYLVFDDLGATTHRDLWVVPLNGDSKPVTYLRTPFNEALGSLSPDGRWMLYTSDESGSDEIYVQSFPEPGTKVRVSTDGGNQAAWRNDGKEILYGSARGVMSVTVTGGAHLEASVPRLLMVPPRTLVSIAGTSDFQRFLLALPSEDAPRSSLTLLTNWPLVRGAGGS